MWLKRSDGEEIYWRKANQIRGWFDRRGLAENCCENEVGLDELKQLLIACEVVASDHELAEEILPTTAGFFFGPQEYGEQYFEDINYTIEALRKFVDSPHAEEYSYEYSEWW